MWLLCCSFAFFMIKTTHLLLLVRVEFGEIRRGVSFFSVRPCDLVIQMIRSSCTRVCVLILATALLTGNVS